jgi:hypothetical protein
MMIAKNRTFPVAPFLAFGLVLALSTASAQSGILNNPQAFPLTLNCGGQQVTAVSPSGPAANVLVLSDNRVLIATSVTQVDTYIDPTTNQPVTRTQNIQFGAGHGQANGIGNLTTCVSQPFTFQVPTLGTVTETLTIVGFFVPRT